jgi:hypothetical protein
VVWSNRVSVTDGHIDAVRDLDDVLSELLLPVRSQLLAPREVLGRVRVPWVSISTASQAAALRRPLAHRCTCASNR